MASCNIVLEFPKLVLGRIHNDRLTGPRVYLGNRLFALLNPPLQFQLDNGACHRSHNRSAIVSFPHHDRHGVTRFYTTLLFHNVFDLAGLTGLHFLASPVRGLYHGNDFVFLFHNWMHHELNNRARIPSLNLVMQRDVDTGAVDRQQGQIGVEHHEDEYGGNHRQESTAVLVASHALYEIDQHLHGHLDQPL